MMHAPSLHCFYFVSDQSEQMLVMRAPCLHCCYFVSDQSKQDLEYLAGLVLMEVLCSEIQSSMDLLVDKAD